MRGTAQSYPMHARAATLQRAWSAPPRVRSPPSEERRGLLHGKLGRHGDHHQPKHPRLLVRVVPGPRGHLGMLLPLDAQQRSGGGAGGVEERAGEVDATGGGEEGEVGVAAGGAHGRGGGGVAAENEEGGAWKEGREGVRPGLLAVCGL